MAKHECNADHLHEEGVINKDEMTPEQEEAINSLSEEEVEQLKKMHGNVKNSGQTTGIVV